VEPRRLGVALVVPRGVRVCVLYVFRLWRLKPFHSLCLGQPVRPIRDLIHIVSDLVLGCDLYCFVGAHAIRADLSLSLPSSLAVRHPRVSVVRHGRLDALGLLLTLNLLKASFLLLLEVSDVYRLRLIGYLVLCVHVRLPVGTSVAASVN